jgi:hypothetical protein
MLKLVPEELDREYKRPAKSLPRPESHWIEWVEAAKTGKPASTDFASSGVLTQICLLGNIAIRQKGKILRYDARAGTFANSDAANAAFQRAYREGWKLPS